MPLHFHHSTMHLIETRRTVWIEGNFGSYKTSLAFRLAYELLKSGKARYLLTNVKSVWADDPTSIVPRKDEKGIPRFLDAVIIMDEGGLFISDSQAAREFTSFMRKINVFLIIPSFEEPASRLTKLRIARTHNLGAFGLPVLVYRTELRSSGTRRQHEYFYWRRPSEIFGIYDTEDMPTDDHLISDFLLEHVDGIKSANPNARHTAGRKLPTMASGWGELEEVISRQEEILESLSIPNGKRKKQPR